MENPMFRGMVSWKCSLKTNPTNTVSGKNDEDLLADVKYLEN